MENGFEYPLLDNAQDLGLDLNHESVVVQSRGRGTKNRLNQCAGVGLICHVQNDGMSLGSVQRPKIGRSNIGSRVICHSPPFIMAQVSWGSLM